MLGGGEKKKLFFSLDSKWWSQSGSNRRPHPCKGCALPAELWPHLGLRRLPKTNKLETIFLNN